MKKSKINKKNIKPFALGCITTLIVIGVIFGGTTLYKNIKHNYEEKKQKEIENSKKETIGGITYIIDYESKNDTKCDALKDVWINGNNYFITKDGTVYQLSDKKYSDTKQNCKILKDDVKIKSVVSNILVSNDNKKYRIEYEYNGDNTNINMKEIDESLVENKRVPTSLYQDNIKYAILYDQNEQYGENPNSSLEFIVLKTDGKLYKMFFKGIYNTNEWYFDYILEKEEVFKDFKDEKIKYFQITKNIDNGYILTDKNIYLQTPTNKECMEYQDIACNYDYIKSKYLKKYIKSMISISVEQNWYYITTKDKKINVSFQQEEK